VDNSTNPSAANGAVYKGLTIATDAHGRTLLYAANFRAGKIDVFDTSFKPATLAKGAFTDPNLPRGYAPFNVQVLNGKVYVTYALQNAAKHDDVAGAGHGFVDVFNLDGTPGLAGNNVRLISRGHLNSPWGLAIAPASFGDLAGALLVGNFGNGRIHAYNPTTGAFLGTLTDPDGEPIQISGLWALKVGTGGTGGDPNTVYFTAGLAGETHGLFGSLAPAAKGTPEGPAEEQEVIAAADVFKIKLDAVQQDLSMGVSGNQLKMDLQALDTSLIDLVRSEIRFSADARRDTSPGGKAAVSSFGAADTAAVAALDSLFASMGSSL
jgi:hypothetical protein